MTDRHPIDMFDNVRILSTPETEAVGLAGLVGDVYGVTTPSVTGIAPIIGQMTEDLAYGVHFEERQETIWFAPHLLELVDHGPGGEIRIKGVPKRWVRTESGKWEEIDLEPERPSWLQRIRDLLQRHR